MDFRLLVDLEAVAVLDSMAPRQRKLLLNYFTTLRSAPDQCADYYELDQKGRRIEISIFAKHSIHYWIDVADRHVKILAIEVAD